MYCKNKCLCKQENTQTEGCKHLKWVQEVSDCPVSFLRQWAVVNVDKAKMRTRKWLPLIQGLFSVLIISKTFFFPKPHMHVYDLCAVSGIVSSGLSVWHMHVQHRHWNSLTQHLTVIWFHDCSTKHWDRKEQQQQTVMLPKLTRANGADVFRVCRNERLRNCS